MSFRDHVRPLPTITVANTDPDGQRKPSKAENNHRTERYLLRVTGQVDITVAGTGVRNRGSILAGLTDIGYTDDGTDKQILDARAARFLADYFAPGLLPATRLAGAGVQAATQLSEVVPLWMCEPGTVMPTDTKYVEVNKQGLEQVFITPKRVITRLAAGGALAGTVTNVSASVEQVYDDDLGNPTMLSKYVRQIVQSVTAANTQFLIDLRDARYIRAILIMQESDEGEVSDIINNVILRGDRYSVLGDAPMPWNDLVEHTAEMGGPNANQTHSYGIIDFARYGRLSTLYNPAQDTNLRLLLGVQPSVTGVGTGSQVRVVLLTDERTAATTAPVPDSL